MACAASPSPSSPVFSTSPPPRPPPLPPNSRRNPRLPSVLSAGSSTRRCAACSSTESRVALDAAWRGRGRRREQLRGRRQRRAALVLEGRRNLLQYPRRVFQSSEFDGGSARRAARPEGDALARGAAARGVLRRGQRRRQPLKEGARGESGKEQRRGPLPIHPAARKPAAARRRRVAHAASAARAAAPRARAARPPPPLARRRHRRLRLRRRGGLRGPRRPAAASCARPTAEWRSRASIRRTPYRGSGSLPTAPRYSARRR